MEVSDGLISVDLNIAQVRAYAMRPDNSNLAVACRKALEKFVDEGFVQQLRDHTCMAGLPHTGDSPKEDHGHADCFFLNKAADEIERLRAEIASMVASAQQLTQLVNEWVDVQPGRTKADMDRRISIAYDLRKAVGR